MQRPLLAATFLLPLCLGLPARAFAQAKAGSNELDIYGGRLFGQALTKTPPFDGTTMLPRLADDQTYGARFTHTFTKDFGVELGVGDDLTHTARHRNQPGVSDLRLQIAELDVTYNFTPDSPIVGYTLLGAGYARVRLEPDLTGTFNGAPATVSGRNRPTGNIGIGARAFATRHLIFRAEVRYRYLGRIVTDNADNARPVSTFETTVGVGWRF